MQLHLFILLAILFKSFLSYGQVNRLGAFKVALEHIEIGKEISFSQAKGKDHDSLVLVYLGDIKTKKGKRLKIVTSRLYWGVSPRATSRVVVFNEKNQYLSYFYLTMTYDVPDKIDATSLVFINEKGSDCTPNLETRVSFRDGIPKSFFLKREGQYGDIYSFAPNL